MPPLSKPPVQPSMVQVLPGGGAPSRVAPDATAVYMRAARFIVQYDAFWAAPQDGPATIAWAERFPTAMLPYASGAYGNYAHSAIADWPRAYHSPNLERLVAVKRRYDPGNVFNFPQCIPLSV